jgi:nucleoid-associated protein YgaU
VLARASQRYIMFRPDGVPVRARVQVTFNEFRNADLEAKEVKRETADYTKTYTVTAGETLSAIAGREYGNPKLWRPIALANDVADPHRLAPGARLVIPRLPYRHMETGEIYQ